MIRWCAWHPTRFGFMGFKRPYLSMTVTHGQCDECFERFTEKARKDHEAEYGADSLGARD